MSWIGEDHMTPDEYTRDAYQQFCRHLMTWNDMRGERSIGETDSAKDRATGFGDQVYLTLIEYGHPRHADWWAKRMRSDLKWVGKETEEA